MPKAIPKPSRTEEVLATVAARYPVGATVTLPSIAEAYGVNEGTASQVRRWARSVGRRAYGDGKRSATLRSGQADRPAAAYGFRLVVDAGLGRSGSSATTVVQASAGQGGNDGDPPTEGRHTCRPARRGIVPRLPPAPVARPSSPGPPAVRRTRRAGILPARKRSPVPRRLRRRRSAPRRSPPVVPFGSGTARLQKSVPASIFSMRILT